MTNTAFIKLDPIDTLPEQTSLVDGHLLFTPVGSTQMYRMSLGTFTLLSQSVKILKLTDPAPTVDGLYRPESVGTYSNTGGLVAKNGYDTIFLRKGGVWSKSEFPYPQATKSIPQFADLSFPVTNTATEKVQCVDHFVPYQLLDGKTSTSADTPSTSPTIWKSMGSNSNGVTIPFSEVISFNNNLAISTKTVNSVITFSALGDYAIIGGSTLVKLTADGTNIPDFSNFKKMSGSQSYVNTAGVVNNCYFFYDGVDAWLNIWQGVGSSNIIYNDVTPPTAPTLTYSNETNTTVNLSWTGATDNVGVTSYEIYKDNILIDTVAASPLTITGLTAATAYTFKVKAKDASGNESAFSNTVSVTTTSQTIVNVVFDSLGGATYDAGSNTLSSSGASTGGLRTTPITGDFEMYTNNAISIASVITLQSAISGGYTWVGASNVQFLIGAYVFDNKLLVNVNATAGNTGTVVADIATTDTFIKMVRAGNNCIVYSSANGTTWTARHTQSGIFTGVANLYPRVIFAIAQSNHASLKLKQ